MTGKWYSKNIQQAEAGLRTDINRGLDRREVKARRQKRGKHDVFFQPQKSYLPYLWHLLTDIPTILLLLTILIAVIFEQRLTLIVGLLILIVYAFVSVSGYLRAHRVFESMNERSLPLAKVLREGKLFLIKQQQLVQGDVIFLSGGDIVPCDARLVEAEELEALETNLTSVAKTVSKSAEFVGWGDLPPSHQRNMVFASTVLTSGRAKAIVCEVGADTLVCKMGKNTPLVSHDQMHFLSVLRRISRIWSVCMMVMIFLITGANLVLGAGSGNLFDTFLTALSLAVASMSEYYMPFGFLIIACGIFTAVRKIRGVSAGAMIKGIGKLDVLRKVDCLVVPLEGVFTSSDQRVESVYTGDDEFEITHAGYAKNCTQAVRYALLSTGLYGAASIKKNHLDGNNVFTPEEEAIIKEAEKLNLAHAELEKAYPLLEHRGVGALNHMETSIVRHRDANVVVVRGGVQDVLSRCTSYRLDGRVLPLDAKKRGEVLGAASSMAKRSCRVIAVASGLTEYSKVVKPSLIQRELTFEGLLAIREPILPGVAMNIQKCKENGMAVVLLTDREDENHISFARALGLIDREDEAIGGSQIGRGRDASFNIERHRLYMGLTVAQKRHLIKTLQGEGRVVGVLAHSLNDIILYREADIGFSQSITISDGGGRLGVDMTARRIPVFNQSGGSQGGSCEALKYVSDVIVSEANAKGEGGFNAVLRSILSAKCIFRNLHRAIRYLLATQTARMAIVLYALLSGTLLLTPVQILYTGLIVDFLAILMIAFSPSSRASLADPMPEQSSEGSAGKLLMSHIFCVLAGLLLAICSASLPLLLTRCGMVLDEGASCSICFYAFLASQWMVLLCSDTYNRRGRAALKISRMTMLAILVEFVILLLCITVKPFGAWFDCVSIPGAAWIGIITIPLLLLIVFFVDGKVAKRRKTGDSTTGGGNE